MLNRREFLVTLLVTPLIPACGSSSELDATTDIAGTTPGPTCDGAGETSTVSQGHTHTLCVALAVLTSPPAEGATFLTSTVSGHLHRVTLTEGQLATIDQGGSVTVTSTSDAGHSHDFVVQTTVIQGAPAPAPTGTPYY
jgi:hypothetical protein